MLNADSFGFGLFARDFHQRLHADNALDLVYVPATFTSPVTLLDAWPGLSGRQLDRSRSLAERNRQSHLFARPNQQGRQSRDQPREVGALIRLRHRKDCGAKRAEGRRGNG
jgi:hypothetical protein